MGKKKNKKKKERENINEKTKVYVIFTILLIALIGVYYYTFHPAINIHLEPFWGAVIVVFIGFGCIFALNQIKDAWFSNVSEVFREKKLSLDRKSVV